MIARSVRISFAGALCAGVVLTSHASRASDHVDGIKTALDNSADITDVFTFTSPKDPNKLVLIMNVNGFARSGSRFSNAVDYKFRIRPIADARTLAPSADPAQERSIVCSFANRTFALNGNQRATCAFNLGGAAETLTFETRGGNYRAGGSAQRGGLRVFAGARSDPWFLDLAKILKFSAGLPVLPVSGVNGLHGTNVLSIVVEVDKARLPGPLLAVTAQTVRK